MSPSLLNVHKLPTKAFLAPKHKLQIRSWWLLTTFYLTSFTVVRQQWSMGDLLSNRVGVRRTHCLHTTDQERSELNHRYRRRNGLMALWVPFYNLASIHLRMYSLSQWGIRESSGRNRQNNHLTSHMLLDRIWQIWFEVWVWKTTWLRVPAYK